MKILRDKPLGECNYRLLDVLLYNTGICLDEYTAWKVILDEPWAINCVLVQIYPVLYRKMSNNLFILHLINVLVNVFFGFCLSTNSEISSSVNMMTFCDWTRQQQWVTVTRRFTHLSVYLKTSAYTTTCFFYSDHFYGQWLLSL